MDRRVSRMQPEPPHGLTTQAPRPVTMSSPVIGIIGGMGPYAGLDLVQKVFDETQAVRDQEHVPVAMLSYAHKIADRTAYVLGQTSENPGKAIAGVARELEALGATVAGIPCNSAHMAPIFGAMTDALQRAGSRIEILHLIRETMRHVKEALPGVSRVGPLSTLGSFRLGLYEKAIIEAGLTPVMPTEAVQDGLVNRAIYDTEFGIKAHSAPATERATGMIEEAIAHVRSRGAEAVILGCTELPLAVPDAIARDATLIDPARALARALIRETFPEKLRP